MFIVLNTSFDAEDFNPYRGNIYDTYKTLDDFTLEEKDSLGRLQKRVLTEEELAEKRINYRSANVVDFLDGDSISNAYLRLC
jgi:sulfatase modifying factor 1